MLRLLVLLLLLANGLYFAWSDGWLRAYGYGPAVQSEPQRLSQQLHPEALRKLTSAEAKRVESQVLADQAPKECLLAGPFDDAQAAVLRRALESALEVGSWQFDSVSVPARWLVYMGKFANAEAMAKKRAELAVMNIAPQALGNPELEPGFSLGGFDTQAAANTELARLMSQRGIRTAKVVQEHPAGQQNQLKLPALTSEQKSRLNDLRPALAGRSLRPCNG
jgi:hypothetical protein